MEGSGKTVTTTLKTTTAISTTTIATTRETTTIKTCQMTMYDQTYFRGKSVNLSGSLDDFTSINFDNAIASVKIQGFI